ncbi:hypothetical protein [Modestobacter sp. SSW1-42]|uniref:hypothetical protein n=1 Tax=Modestobacter sp. SSW1-42 TaxID=596372 RepID=UPI0039860EE8
MTSWAKGAAEVEQLIADRELQRAPGAQLAAQATLDRARQLLTSAGTLLETDPGTAFIIAYDAARQAGAAVLAQQGLRATHEGGHIVVERALRAQFEPGFTDFGYLRRRRHELEYPGPTGPEITSVDEARQALTDATAMVEAIAQLLPALDIF